MIKKKTKVRIEATWSGDFPCLCMGEWSLIVDGKDYSHLIPWRNSPAQTLGTYRKWSFNENWTEVVWSRYNDGLTPEEWVEKNREWLISIPADSHCVYKAFQEKDWRHGECGGCI